MALYDSELVTAREAAQKAGAFQIERRGNLTGIDLKADRSPVTEVDRTCESIVRDMLLARFPADGFLGEETGHHKGNSGRTWIVDPLDGTRPYIRGIPTHSVLIALEDGEKPVVGVMYLPAMHEMYWAQKDCGAFLNGTAIHVSHIGDLQQAMGSALGFVEKAALPEGTHLMELMKKWDYTYGFMDVYSYGCVASGRLDACVNLLDKAWDCAAAACVVTEAGGRYSDIFGNENIHNGSFVITNGIVHDAVLSFFNE